VLQDGAAAQYGSDAIAGVVNIILKSNNHGGTATATGGGYVDGGGRTADASANIGLEPFADAYLSLTAESKYHGYSDRGGSIRAWSTRPIWRPIRACSSIRATRMSTTSPATRSTT
jgi:outer membrane receptor protein involved in Fe transport